MALAAVRLPERQFFDDTGEAYDFRFADVNHLLIAIIRMLSGVAYQNSKTSLLPAEALLASWDMRRLSGCSVIYMRPEVPDFMPDILQRRKRGIRRTILSMLKNNKTEKVGIKNKRLCAAWDEDYRLQVLFGE